MPLEEAARTGGRATVEDLQRSSSMPLEDYSGGGGKNMGELGAPLGTTVISHFFLARQAAEGLQRPGQEHGELGAPLGPTVISHFFWLVQAAAGLQRPGQKHGELGVPWGRLSPCTLWGCMWLRDEGLGIRLSSPSMLLGDCCGCQGKDVGGPGEPRACLFLSLLYQGVPVRSCRALAWL